MNELTTIPKLNLTTIVANSDNRISAVEAFGIMAAKSGFYGCENVQQGMVIALTCMELGIGLHEFGRQFDIIKGKPRKKAMASLVEFERLGGKFAYTLTGDEPAQRPEDRAAEVVLKLGEKTVTYRYSMADAVAEKLVKPDSRWEKRPGNMLRARAVSNGLGIICPSIYAGEIDQDSEVIDVQTIKLDAQPVPLAKLAPAVAHPVPPVTPAAPAVATITPPATIQSSQNPPTPPPVLISQPVPSASVVPPPPTVENPVAAQPGTLAEASLSVLPADVQAQLIAAIGQQNITAAVKFALAQNPPWLLPDQGLECLTPARAGRIIKNSGSFLRAIEVAK